MARVSCSELPAPGGGPPQGLFFYLIRLGFVGDFVFGTQFWHHRPRMAKRAPAQPASCHEESDQLVKSVDRLTTEVQLLRQVMDEIREDFSWVTRNSPPARAIEHVHVKRMALDPCAEDWGEHLEIERSTYDPGSLRSMPPALPVDPERVDELTTAFETKNSRRKNVLRQRSR